MPGVAQAVLEREVLDTVRAVFEERMVVMFYLDDGTMGTPLVVGADGCTDFRPGTSCWTASWKLHMEVLKQLLLG